MLTLRSALPFALSALAACTDPVSTRLNPLPPDAREFVAPAIYTQWWTEVKACSGRTADFAPLRWYAVPGDQVPLGDGSLVGGYYDPTGHRIVISEQSKYSGGHIRHEMLHALIPATGGHPREQFLARCLGTVSCGFECTQDAGPPPRDGLTRARVTLASMALTVSVDPATVSQRDSTVFVRAVITVRNPSVLAIQINMPPSEDAGPPVSVAYNLLGGCCGVSFADRVWDASIVQFAPGETKRWLLDFKASELDLGEHVLSVVFGDRDFPARHFLVVP